MQSRAFLCRTLTQRALGDAKHRARPGERKTESLAQLRGPLIAGCHAEGGAEERTEALFVDRLKRAEPTRQRLRLSGRTELFFITAGEAAKPAVLLLHGSPSSARMFRDVIPELSEAAHVIALGLPGFGESDVLQSRSFPAFGQAISELLDQLSIGPRYIYLHDYGAPVGSTSPSRRPNECWASSFRTPTLIEPG